MTEQEVWLKAFFAALQSASTVSIAADVADSCVEEYRKRSFIVEAVAGSFNTEVFFPFATVDGRAMLERIILAKNDLHGVIGKEPNLIRFSPEAARKSRAEGISKLFGIRVVIDPNLTGCNVMVSYEKAVKLEEGL